MKINIINIGSRFWIAHSVGQSIFEKSIFKTLLVLCVHDRFYVFITGFMLVNLRVIPKEAAGPGPGRTWAGPGPGPPPIFGFFMLFYRFCVTKIGPYLMDF